MVTGRVDDGVVNALELTNGRFRQELDVPPGEHQVTVEAVQGGQHGQAMVGFRVDFFAHVSGGQITINDHPFRFVGLTTPSLREMAWQFEQGGGANRVDEVIREAKALGVTVLRVPAYDDRPDSPMAIHTGPGMYNESGLAALDLVIDRAGRAGLKLVLPLVGWNEDRGGVVQYLKWGGYLAPVPGDRALFFNAGPIRELFKDHVRHLLERTNSVNHRAYKDEPAILGWEVMDGVDGAGLFDPARGGQEIQDFFSDLTALLKSEAPDHLAATGEAGFDADVQAYGPVADQLGAAGLRGLIDGSHSIAWHRTLRLPTVDYATIRIDPAELGLPAAADPVASLGAAWLRGHAAIAATEGKPLVVSVARINQTAGLDLPARRAAMQAWLDEAASLEIAGILPGDFQPDVVADDPYGWSLHDGTQPADPANQYADEVQAAAARNP
jgi:mannan endo-1,4-beta-mannosidase